MTLEMALDDAKREGKMEEVMRSVLKQIKRGDTLDDIAYLSEMPKAEIIAIAKEHGLSVA